MRKIDSTAGRIHSGERNARAATSRRLLLALMITAGAVLAAQPALAQPIACSGRGDSTTGSGCDVVFDEAVTARVPLRDLPRAVNPQLRRGAKRQQFVIMKQAFIEGLRDGSAIAQPTTLELFEDVTGRIVFDRSDALDAAGSRRILHGRIVDQPGSRVLFAVRSGIVSAQIETSDGRSFSINPAGSGVHRISEVDVSELTCGTHPGDELSQSPGSITSAPHLPDSIADLGSEVASYDTGFEIDVLVAYSQAASSRFGGNSGIQNEIDLVIAATNQAYANSGVTQRLRLVHTALIDYQEHTEPGRNEMQVAKDDTTNGNLPQLQSLRDQYGADMVSFWVDAPPPAGANTYICGIAGLAGYTTGVANMAPHAYSVVNTYCSASSVTFAHELGHNQGAWHDPDTLMFQLGTDWQGFVDFANGLPSYVSFGYCDPAGSFTTIMGYGFYCDPVPGANIMRFSNPQRYYGGAVTGDSWSDVHFTLNETYPYAVNWRESAGSGPGGGGTIELQNGIPVHDQSVAQGQSLHYSLQVPADATSLTFETRGGTGDADLYVKFGSAPTTASYDCRPYSTTNNETCDLTPRAGTWYVMVHGYEASSGVTVVGTHGSGAVCAPSDVLCDGQWGGYAASKGSAKRLGRQAWDAFATMNTSGGTFSYVDSDGLTLTGPIHQDGRRLRASFSSASIAALESYLANKILHAMRLGGNDPGWVQVSIDRSSLKVKPRLKLGRRGGPNSIKLLWSVKFSIYTGIGQTNGKVRAKMTLYEY